MANIRLGQLIMMNVKQMKEISQSLRDLGEDDTANKYDELVKEKERLEKELLDYKNLDSEIFKQENVIEEKLRLIDDLIVFRYSERKRIIKSWNEKNNNLQLDLKLFGDLDENERIFREIIDKTAGEFEADILEYNANNVPVNGIIFRVGNSFIQGESIEKCIERLNTEKYSFVHRDENIYSKRFLKYFNKHIEIHPDIIYDIDTWIPEDKIELQLNINGTFRPVDAGSPGQRASAILSLIFSISDMPVIIDQPEDDLDNRNIMQIVVEGVKKLRQQQQVILVTHNPNIVVNTNAEWIVQLDFHEGQIHNVCAGALQSHDVRDAICEVMEGGKEALKKRYYRIFKALED